jgi:hypothetical protein
MHVDIAMSHVNVEKKHSHYSQIETETTNKLEIHKISESRMFENTEHILRSLTG